MNDIKQLIFNVRGMQVLLDSDVARLYNYETKYIIRAMKRNIARFPENFCFQLTENEYIDFLRFQFGTLKITEETGSGKHRKYLPYVFTEQGIAMLSGLLKNDIAIEMSINIMNAFVEMRRFISNNAGVFERLTNVEYKLLEHDKNFNELFDLLQKEKEFKQHIFFNGQIYDAYSLLIEIISKAKKEIIIIDNYVDKTILDLLSKKNKKCRCSHYY